MKLLLSKKANINATSTNSSPLHEAVRLLSLMVEENFRGHVSISQVRQHNQQMADILLAGGANINLTTDCGKTPLHFAIQEGIYAFLRPG